MRAQQTKKVTVAAAVTAVALAIGSLSVIGGSTAQADVGLPGDGTTSTTAGASCWGIKQAHPDSGDGTYWLNTAQLERPQEFHCDMSTDGGGWVLVGRGREGWTFNPLGQGSPQTVRETVSGPGAFGPAALDTGTIEGLLGTHTVDSLPDGIRLTRATNSNGTSTQDYRLFPQDPDWTWGFPDGKLLHKVVADGQTYNGSNTYDTSRSVDGQVTNQLSGRQGFLRMWTWEWGPHDDLAGFSFGSGVGGASNSSSNHLWQASNEGYPVPFTQVWLRPEIANDAAGFSPIPAEGFDAESKPADLNNRSEVAPWGVVGLNHSGETRIEPWNTNVLSLHVDGDRTFVGGRFNGVQNGPGGTEISQPWLAAFDLDGNWIDTFRPQLDGRVWDMITTPDGKLVIAGDFDEVNGTPGTAGMAKIDPVTGIVDTSFKADFDRTSGDMIVRTLDQHAGYIYASGSFNRLTAANWGQIKVSHNISLRATDGRPGSWRPRTSGHVVDIDVTDDGSRVLMGGFFNRVNDDYNHGYNAITDAATGNPIDVGAWEPAHTSAKYQQAVKDLGDGRIFTGGSQHNIHLWDWNRDNLLDSAITKQGGDTQVIEIVGDRAYIGCHCGDYVYEGSNSFSNPTATARKTSPINLIGAWDTETWTYDTEWYPSSLKGDRGEGIWAVDSDSRGCLWVGGDLNRGSYSGNADADWLGGFARFCAEDATPPTAPTDLSATISGSGVELTWGASTDDSGSVFYDIYRDDRVIATTFGTSYTDPEIEGASHLYTVRAADPAGNRSASPAPIAVNGPSPVIGEVLAFGSTWRYADDGSDQGTAWRDPAFDDAGWGAGPAKIGWGRWDVVTTVGPNKPNTLYLRSTFEIDDPAQVRLLDLQASVATGAVIYVNGVEAGRIHMPDGEVTASTPASGYIWGEEERRLKSVAVPADLLVPGTNSVAVEVHNMTPGGSRLFFDLQGTAYGSNGDNSAPTAPSLTATPNGTTSIDLAWTPSTDDEAIGGYVVRRDGQPIVTRGPSATGFSDVGVDTAVPHTYTVSAFDMNGNATASNAATVDMVIDPNLLAFGETWRYFYLEGGPTGAWADPAFDDSTWGTGVAEFGFGEGDEGTVISTGPTPRPATAYFRTTVDVADPAAFGSYVANVVRDDGVAVYVNGVEIGRDNLPAGPLTFDTLASELYWTNADERTPVPFVIPASAFVPGTNTIAVEVHNGDRWSGDLSFDLQLVGQP